jgi:hypothetical protein
VLASLAATATSALHCLDAYSIDTCDRVGWVLNPCSLIAADLIQLATHQMQQAQANHAAAVRLATAAQRLAGACITRTVRAVTLLLRALGEDISCTASESQLLQQLQQQQQQQASAPPPAMAGPPFGRAYSSSDLEFYLVCGQRCLRTLLSLLLQLQYVMAGRVGAVNAAQEDLMAAAARYLSAGDKEPARADVVRLQQAMWSCQPRVQLVGCNHLHCTNLSGPSAEGLVAGRKGVRCGGCRVARYCSPACQQADWPRHRHMCRRLAAGAGARPSAPPQQAVGQQQDGAMGRRRKRAR